MLLELVVQNVVVQKMKALRREFKLKLRCLPHTPLEIKARVSAAGQALSLSYLPASRISLRLSKR